MPVTEDHEPNPTSVHGLNKLAVEKYLHVYGHVHGLAWTIARLTNPYGPGQPSDRTAYGVVNHMIHRALAGDRILVYGDGRQQRDYIYIDDAVAALLRMAELAASSGRTYNVGSGVGTRLVDMARAIAAMAGGGRLETIAWPPLAERIETGDFVADIGRIHRELGVGAARLARGRAGANRGVLSGARCVSNERIRVVYLAHAFMVGGAEEMVLNLVRRLPPRFEPAVCCIHEAGPIGDEIRRTGTSVSVLGLTPGIRRPGRRPQDCGPPARRSAADRPHVPAHGEPVRPVGRDPRASADRDWYRSEHLRAKASGPRAGRTAPHVGHRSRGRVRRVGQRLLHGAGARGTVEDRRDL